MKNNRVIVNRAETAMGRYLTQECRKMSIQTEPGDGKVDAMLFHCPQEPDFDPVEAARHLAEVSPAAAVVVSSWEVYPEGVDPVMFENSRVSPDTEYGERCLRLEQHISLMCSEMGIPVVILRPAMMFGSGITGEAHDMFMTVIKSRFFTIRGVEAPRSAVCAIDVAKAALLMAGREGIYNISDGRSHSLHSLADAMSANTGECKRTPVVPMKAAGLLARICDCLGGRNGTWGSAALKRKMTGREVDITRFEDALPDFEMYNTVDVIAGNTESYPYQDR